jgi:hypothetical protein
LKVIKTLPGGPCTFGESQNSPRLPPSAPLPPLLLCSTAATALPTMCRAPPRSRAALRQATCCPSTCPAAPRPRTGFSSPRHAACCLPELLLAVARRRCKTISTTSCFLAIPRVTPLPCRRPPDLVLSHTRIPHVALLLPELRCAATCAAGVTAPVSA